MPGDPNACREHAKNCLRIASESHSDHVKKHFEQLAQRWLALATDLEVAQALLEAWGEPLEPGYTPPTDSPAQPRAERAS